MPSVRRKLDFGASPSKRRRTIRPATIRFKRESQYFNQVINHNNVASSTTNISDITITGGSQGRSGSKVVSYALDVKMLIGSVTRCVVYVPKQANDTLALTDVGAAVKNDEFWVLHDMLYDSDDCSTINFRIRQMLGIEFSDGQVVARKNPIKMYLLAGGGATETIIGHTKLWFKDC